MILEPNTLATKSSYYKHVVTTTLIIIVTTNPGVSISYLLSLTLLIGESELVVEAVSLQQ